MKELYGTSLTRRLLWALGLGLGAVVLVPLLMVWVNTLTGLTETAAAPLTVSLRMLEATGWPWQRLLAAELGAAFAFGASVGLAVPPMEGSGRGVAVRTAVHLLLSSGLFALLCAVCGLMPAVWQGWLVVLGLYWFAYAVVWLLRYLRWRAELQSIRRELGLAPEKKDGPALGRLGPYVLLAAGVELAGPPVLRLLERGADVPVLTGLFYPFLMLPFFCLCSGWAAGRRLGVPPALGYGALCALLTVPNVFLLYNDTALFQTGVAAAFALAGVLAGLLTRRKKRR